MSQKSIVCIVSCMAGMGMYHLNTAQHSTACTDDMYDDSEHACSMHACMLPCVRACTADHINTELHIACIVNDTMFACMHATTVYGVYICTLMKRDREQKAQGLIRTYARAYACGVDTRNAVRSSYVHTYIYTYVSRHTLNRISPQCTHTRTFCMFSGL